MDEPIRARGPSEPPSSDESDALAGWLDELEWICEAATPGPWTVNDSQVGEGQELFAPDGHDVAQAWAWHGDRGAAEKEANARFIAAARHALPKLIAKVRELQAELDRTDKRLRWETTKDDSERQQLERELFGSSTP